jgi:hypothetical protein
MTNEDVIKMAKAGIAEDVIITAIRQAARRNFDLSANGLIELKLGKVPDAIVRAMQAAEPVKTADPAPAPPPVRPAVPAPSRPPAPAATPPVPLSPQEPMTPGELFFVMASGGLMPLERVKLREAKANRSRSQQDIEFYLDGSSSPVVIRADEPQGFAIRMLGGNRGGSPTADEAQKHFLLTKLQSAEGRRYLTRVVVQFDVRSYGRATPGVDPKRFERLAVSFLLTPKTPLAPGEYVIRMGGAHNFEFNNNLNSGDDRWAFVITDR